MSTRPLLIFDTNILMDVLLERSGGVASLLVQLAEEGHIDLTIPEYVLFEFRGTALRLVRSEQESLKILRQHTNGWKRYGVLAAPAEEIKSQAQYIEQNSNRLPDKIEEIISRLRKVATLSPHTQEIHFRGDLRYLQGLPPDRPVDGIKDCRIYEAILEVARQDQGVTRARYLVTSDSDFDYPTLHDELRRLGVTLHNKTGELYGALHSASSNAHSA